MRNLELFSKFFKFDVLSCKILFEGLYRLFEIADLIAFDRSFLGWRGELFFQRHNFKL